MNVAGANEIGAEVLGKVLDLTPRRIQQLANEGVFPRAKRGLYPLVLCTRAYIGYLREAADRAPVSPEERDGRRRKVLAEAATAELDLEDRRGTTANVTLVGDVVEAEYSNVRERLLGIPGKLGGDLEPHQVDRVAAEIDEALEELSDGAAVIGRASGRGASAPVEAGRPQAAAAPRPRPVGRSVPARGGKDKRDTGKVAVRRATSQPRGDDGRH